MRRSKTFRTGMRLFRLLKSHREWWTTYDVYLAVGGTDGAMSERTVLRYLHDLAGSGMAECRPIGKAPRQRYLWRYMEPEPLFEN